MTVTDSDVIIGIFEFVGRLLDQIAAFLSTDFGMITTLTIAAAIGVTLLHNKLEEFILGKKSLQNQQLENKINNYELIK